MVGVWYWRKLRGTKEASNGGRVRVCIIHGLNISHKELTYLLQKFISHRNKVLHAYSQGGGWQELTIARPRASRKDKQSKYNARQFGYIVNIPYVHASGITNLNTNILTKHNHLLVPPTYYHLYIAKLLQGIKHIIFSDLRVLCRIL